MFQTAFYSAPMWAIGRAERPGLATKLVVNAVNALGMSTRYLPFASGDFGPESARFEGNLLTSNRERFERFMGQIEAEPRLALGAPTLGWVKQAIASIDVLHAPGFAEAIETPIRVCSAGENALVSNAAHAAIAKRLPTTKRVVIDGSRHELLIEIDAHRDRSFAVFDELMDEVKI